MAKKVLHKGVQGPRIRLEPDVETGSMLSQESPIQRGKVLAVGSPAICKVGDIIVVSDWRVEKIVLGGEIRFYVPNDAILDIL